MYSPVKEYARLRDEQISIYECYARQHGMNYKGLLILLWLYNNPKGISQNFIAKKTLSTKQVVNAVVKNYMQKGYVLIETSKADKRKKIVQLTEEGIAYAKNIADILDEAETKSFSALNSREQQVLLEATKKFSGTLRGEFAALYPLFGECP